MRLPLLLPVLLLPLACTTPTRIVATADDHVASVEEVADEVASADVVVLGELHETPPVHELHLQLIEALHARRGNMVIAMEMFERDTQTVMLQYLTGFVDEATFRASARPPSHYDRDYRSVIEFAKANGLVVLAANAPRKLASQVAKEGVESVAGNAHVARETTAPQDEYWDAFVEAMKEHPGLKPEMLQRFYASQCLKDDTMAESITDHVAQRRGKGDRPLVVLICGKMHSDHGRGTVARIKSRMPELDVRVLSAEAVADVGADLVASTRMAGAYVIVTREVERASAAAPVAVALPAPVATPEPTASAPTSAAVEDENPEGLRPALGFMPDYGGAEKGVLVGTVREGGPAQVAGIEEGDIIVALAGTEITDVEHYTEVLGAQRIGKTITVRVRRETAEVDLQVKIGSRSSSR